MKDPKCLAFETGERLYRTVASDQVLRTGKVKPSALRPQFSVQRSRYVGEPEHVQLRGKFNGVAGISVDALREIRGEVLAVHCIYEPSKEDEAHSLIALSTDVPFGSDGIEQDFERVRAAIASAMNVAKSPSRDV